MTLPLPHHALCSVCLLLSLGVTGEPAPQSWPVPAPDTSGLPPASAQRLSEVRAEVVAHSDSVAAWSKLGGACDAYELLDCAAAAYDHARKLAPDDFRWPYLLAIVKLRSEEAGEDAVTLLREAVEKAPTYAPAHFHLGLILAEQGKRDAAAAEYRKAIEMDPDQALPHRNLGQLLLAKGDTAGAIDSLERAARLDPNDRGVFAALTQAYGRVGDRAKAQAAAASARRLKPVRMMEDPVRADVVAEAVDMAAVERRAQSHMEQHEYEEAIALLEFIAEFWPTDPNVLRSLGLANLALERPGLAENYLVRALQAKPDLVEVRVMLARLLAEQGRNTDAIQQAKRAAQDAPTRADVRLMLAGLLLEESWFREAADQYEQASKLGPLDVDSRVLFGEALLQCQDFRAAVEELSAAVDSESGNAEAHYLLAKAYQGLGEARKAEAHLRRAVSIERKRNASGNAP